jgi:hypothetical protein
MTDTLADALPREIARVTAIRDSYIKMATEHPDIAAGMQITIAIMGAEIDRAVRASVAGDIVEMIRCHQSLKDYSDD